MTVTYGWLGPSHWVGANPGDEIPSTQDEAVAKIEDLYNTGKPLFTKDHLWFIHDQLTAPLEKGDKISVMGLDGATVNFEVNTGDIRDEPREDMEYLM